jgi:hypothetical protein
MPRRGGVGYDLETLQPRYHSFGLPHKAFDCAALGCSAGGAALNRADDAATQQLLAVRGGWQTARRSTSSQAVRTEADRLHAVAPRRWPGRQRGTAIRQTFYSEGQRLLLAARQDLMPRFQAATAPEGVVIAFHGRSRARGAGSRDAGRP